VPLLVARLQNAVSAKAIGYCAFVPCQGAFDEAKAAHVTAAFRSDKLRNAQSLIRNDEPDGKAVLIGKGWRLTK
jgi:hypothetical protein